MQLKAELGEEAVSDGCKGSCARLESFSVHFDISQISLRDEQHGDVHAHIYAHIYILVLGEGPPVGTAC